MVSVAGIKRGSEGGIEERGAGVGLGMGTGCPHPPHPPLRCTVLRTRFQNSFTSPVSYAIP